MTTNDGAWFTIAQEIGGHTVEELKSKMSNAEFVKWCVHLTNQADDLKHHGR